MGQTRKMEKGTIFVILIAAITAYVFPQTSFARMGRGLKLGISGEFFVNSVVGFNGVTNMVIRDADVEVLAPMSEDVSCHLTSVFSSGVDMGEESSGCLLQEGPVDYRLISYIGAYEGISGCSATCLEDNNVPAILLRQEFSSVESPDVRDLMSSTGKNLCYLNTVSHSGIGVDTSSCSVEDNNGMWQLIASSEGVSSANCKASCIEDPTRNIIVERYEEIVTTNSEWPYEEVFLGDIEDDGKTIRDCFLVEVGFKGGADGGSQCRIKREDNQFLLVASASESNPEPTETTCRAQCISWDPYEERPIPIDPIPYLPAKGVSFER